MEDTGRISRGLVRSARRIVFGSSCDEAINVEMEHIAEVDRAHLIMLAERKIVDKDRARAVLLAVEELRSSSFAPLRGHAAPRGIYILYEDYLINKLGCDTAGILQTGRSRNDLNATTMRLRLRRPYLRLLRSSFGLQSVLLRKAAQFSDVVMPAYTHYQPAVPITYGHYLAGVAAALNRDLDGLLHSIKDACRCPLGAGAVGGTSWPINTERTSALLGFEEPAANSVDAVASRDIVLRVLAAAAVLGVTVSRLAADMLQWTAPEFGFLFLGDHLIGSSSMMPQKRNPFLLEHVQGRSASALGAFVSAATCMHAKPFTNSIAANTEACFWRSLRETSDATTLVRIVLHGAEPRCERMLARAVDGETVATEMANRLVARTGIAFRTAHRVIGARLREKSNHPVEVQVTPDHLFTDQLDPSFVVQASRYGGGPASDSIAACLSSLEVSYQAQRKQVHGLASKWRTCKMELDRTVKEFLM